MTKTTLHFSIVALCCLTSISWPAKGFDLDQEAACDTVNGIQPFCTFRRPEDMVLIPGSRLLIISETGGLDRKHGNRDLVLFDTQSKEQSVLYSAKSVMTTDRHPALWGEKNCSKPVWFAPHGIDLLQRPDGKLALFVVNHGKKESVQMFSVELRNNNVALEWRGCVAFESGNSLNDVAALPGGGFVTGSTLAASQSTDGQPDSKPRSVIYSWMPETGLSPLAMLHGASVNGVSVSPKGSFVFANTYSDSSKIVKISLKTGEIKGTAKTTFYADNNSWSQSGELLVTTIGPNKGLSYLQCDKEEPDYCPLPFEIVAIDPDTLSSRVLFSHLAGPPFGAATVAVEVGDELYFGAPVGNRIAKIKIP